MKPTVSIVIPAKNEAEFLPLSLSALIKAIEYCDGPAEIIIVDNDSTDRTVEIANSFGCKVIEDNVGTISGLRNRGANAATGEYLGFIDADCVVAESWLSTCLQSLQNVNVGIVGTRAIPDLVAATWVEKGWYRLISGVERPDYPAWIGTSNMLMLRSVFLEAGCFDENLATAEDVNLCRKVLSKHSIKLEKHVDTIHLRESKTIFQLIRREIWRGRYSIREALTTGAMPTSRQQNIFYLANFTFLTGIASGFLIYNWFFVVSVMLHLLLPLIMIVKKRAIIRSIVQFFQVYGVAYFYILARTTALVIELIEILGQHFKVRRC